MATNFKLSPNFWYSEAIESQTARRLGIDNTPSKSMIEELKLTAMMMEEIRTLLGNKPITPTSWYRCRVLDVAVAGNRADVSHHTLGGAVDFICPRLGTPYDICMVLADHVQQLGIGQLIHEFGGWVHVSRLPVQNNINKILTIDQGKPQVRVGIHPARFTS